jgi:16S rRNA (guanine527-N7)-methyltransferase
MHPARIAELLEPFLHDANDQRPAANDALYKDISTYIDILQHWNARLNLTAIRDEEKIVTRHFGESLFAASHLFPFYPVSSSVSSVPSVVKGVDIDVETAEARSPKARLADIGSGAGFPGIPIKLWAPNISLTLIESNHKKATFLKEVARALTLTDINIQTVRAETLPPATFEVVTLRAVERLPEILPVAANLLAPQGSLALLIASPQLESIRSKLPNLTWDPQIPIPNSQSRVLLIGHLEPRTSTSGTDRRANRQTAHRYANKLPHIDSKVVNKAQAAANQLDNVPTGTLSTNVPTGTL